VTDNPYEYWQAKLAGEDPPAPADRSHPPCGRWRTPRGEPLAVWPAADGSIVAVYGKGGLRRKMNTQEMARMAEMGGHGQAISVEEYDRVAVKLLPWSDMDPVVAQQTAPQVGPGHNQPPTDTHTLLTEQIENAKRGTEAYREIADDETAAKAQSLRARLQELARTADAERETLKRPFLEAGRKIDATWMPLIALAREAAQYLAAKMGAWETEKVRRARTAEEERKAAEALAQERDVTLPPPEQPAPQPDVPGRIRGAYGRAASVGTVKVINILDWTRAAQHFSYDSGVQDAIRKAAKRAVDLGANIPEGIISITEERKVR
jgi:hypothetical protein